MSGATDDGPAPLRVLVFNPASGRRKGAALAGRIAGILGAEGPTTLLPTEREGHACDLVEDMLRSRQGQATDVFVLGGDGTLNEALLGAWRAGALAPGSTGLRVAVLPAGTTNVVARSLGLPSDPVDVAHAIMRGRSRAIDLGLCRLERAAPGAGGRVEVERPFALACGIGLDAEVSRAVPSWLKRLFGRHAYSLVALRACGDRARGLVVEWEDADGRHGQAEAASVIVGNSPLYGGPARLARGAAMDDGLLELAILSSTRVVPVLRAGVNALLSQAADAEGVRVVAVKSVRASAAIPVAVHVDAEQAGDTPVAIEVLPRVLTMRVG